MPNSTSNLGLSFAGVNCLVVFPTHLNPNNFLFYITSNFTPIHVYPCLKTGHDHLHLFEDRFIDKAVGGQIVKLC